MERPAGGETSENAAQNLEMTAQMKAIPLGPGKKRKQSTLTNYLFSEVLDAYYGSSEQSSNCQAIAVTHAFSIPLYQITAAQAASSTRMDRLKAVLHVKTTTCFP